MLWVFDNNSLQVSILKKELSNDGGLGVACWPLVPKFEGSNPAEAF